MAELPDPNVVALQGCLRKALGLVLARDEVELQGWRGRVERLHEDRTCTVSFPEGTVLPPGLGLDEPDSRGPEEAEPRVVAIEVRAGLLVDLLRFCFSDGAHRDHGQQGGAFAGRFELEEGEWLTGISGSAGDSLDSVQFHTSRGRSSQIFGNAGGGVRFELAAPEGQAIVGVRRGAGNCAAIRGLICSGASPPAFRSGQRVVVQGLASKAGQALNGLEGTVTGRAASGRFTVAVDSCGGAPKALKAENLLLVPGRPEVRVLLRDCQLQVPWGNFCRRRRVEQDVEVLRWRGRCELDAQGRARVQGSGQPPAVGREGVHHVLRVASSGPLPMGAQVTSLKMNVVGMDQGWGNSGDSGVVLYVARAGVEAAAPLDAEEPLAKVMFDHFQHPSHYHSTEVTGLFGPLAPQPGDRLEAALHCPQYPGWNAHVQEVAVTVHCLSEQEEPFPGELPETWEVQSAEAFRQLKDLGNDSLLTVDPSHLSLRGQERQRVWAGSSSLCSADANVPPVVPHLRELCRGGPTWGAERLLGKLDSLKSTAGAPQDPEHRRARYGALRGRVHKTLRALEAESTESFLETVCTHYAEAAEDCIYRWEREIANMHDLVTGECTGIDALQAEDAVLLALCEARRQLAESALHSAKGAAGNSDMHFESFFYGSIHFGLPEQLEAARDPNRLNYRSLGMLRPADVQKELTDAYTPAAIRGFLRKRLLDSTAEGSQELRERLLDWLRGHVPAGFQPEVQDQAARQEAWLFEQCHDEHFRMRDWALNFMLCGMHVLRADRAACLLGDPADVGSPELLAPGRLPGSASGEEAAPAAEARGGRCAVQ